MKAIKHTDETCHAKEDITGMIVIVKDWLQSFGDDFWPTSDLCLMKPTCKTFNSF